MTGKTWQSGGGVGGRKKINLFLKGERDESFGVSCEERAEEISGGHNRVDACDLSPHKGVSPMSGSVASLKDMDLSKE